MRGRSAAGVALALLCTIMTGCATPGERMTGSAPPAGKGAAILSGYIVQHDAVNRSGDVLIRKIDPQTGHFLPEAPDTIAKFALLPAFRFEDVLRRGDPTGRSRLHADDLTPIVLAPGLWAVERAWTSSNNANLIMSSSSLTGQDRGLLDTWGFEVFPGQIVALPLLAVSPQEAMGRPGPASVIPETEGAARLGEVSTQGASAVAVQWRSVSVPCPEIRYEGLQLRGEVECAPR